MIMTNELASAASVVHTISGMRVLVIEDIWIVAQSYVELRVIVSGPAGTVAEAMSLIERRIDRGATPIDAALVDMDLGGEMAYGVVDALNARGVPVVVVTGCDVEPEFANKVRAVLKKPIRAEALITALRGIAAAT